MQLTLVEPDHINEVGVKWWLHKGLTEWATRPDTYGIVLRDHRVWIVEHPSGQRAFLLTDQRGALHECKEMEAMACKIDFLKLRRHYLA